MSKSSLAILLFLVLAVAGVVVGGALFLWTDDQAEEVRVAAPEPRPQSDPPPDEPVAMEEFQLALEDAEAASDELPEGFLQAVRAEQPPVDEGRALVVHVVDAETEAPAGWSDVYLLDGFDGPELTDPFSQHWSAWAEEHGQRFQTDAHGRVELPSIQEWAIVSAHRPGAYGFAKLGPEHDDVETVALHPDETVTVRVLDRDDRPVAEVPVAVIQRVPHRGDVTKKAKGKDKSPPERRTQKDGEGPPPFVIREERRAQRLTDANGIAVFRHFQVYRREHAEWWPPQHIDQFEAVLTVPLRQPQSTAFAGRPVTTDTLELRLPPTGAITLRTIDRDGRPFTQPVHAELRMHEEEGPEWSRWQVRKDLNQAAIEFPFAGLGLLFTVHARLDDKEFQWESPPFAGPSTVDEAVTLDLVVAPEEAMLFGRLRDEADRPLAGARPSFLIHGPDQRLKGAEVTLDADGRFHLPYRLKEEHRGPFRLRIRRDDVVPPAGLAMALPTLPLQGITDLGDLRVTPLTAIASGTVVDDLGVAVEGATVQLQREREVGAKRPRMEYLDEHFTRARTDENGAYQLFGEFGVGRHRLRVEAKQYFPAESPPFRSGDRVDLTLSRKSQVVGTVLTPDWMPSEGVRLQLESVDGLVKAREDQVRDADGRKFIFFDWVPPGSYNLVIRAQDFPDPILRVNGLAVAPGQEGIHPRLLDLDLRSFLFRFEITAVDEQGRSVRPDQPLLARIVRPDGREGHVGFPWRKNQAEVFSVSPQLDVWPMANGYRAEPTVLVHGPSELRFLSIPPLEVKVPGLRREVGTTPVWIRLTALEDSDLPGTLEVWDRRSGRIAKWYGGQRSILTQVGKGDSARVRLMNDGRYRVVAFLEKSPLPLGTVDVRLVPGERPQKVSFRVDPAAMQAALSARDATGQKGR